MADPENTNTDYILDDQVGFMMRRANQRHLALFAQRIPGLTPTQFAALAKLCQLGQVTQNALGRATAMDGATIKGVVDRLRRRGLVASFPDPEDQRRMYLIATEDGRQAFAALIADAHAVTAETLAPLDEGEQTEFLRLLQKLL